MQQDKFENVLKTMFSLEEGVALMRRSMKAMTPMFLDDDVERLDYGIYSPTITVFLREEASVKGFANRLRRVQKVKKMRHDIIQYNGQITCTWCQTLPGREIQWDVRGDGKGDKCVIRLVTEEVKVDATPAYIEKKTKYVIMNPKECLPGGQEEITDRPPLDVT